jgi:hypothetical protein
MLFSSCCSEIPVPEIFKKDFFPYLDIRPQEFYQIPLSKELIAF